MNQFICSSTRIISHLCCRTPSQPTTSPATRPGRRCDVASPRVSPAPAEAAGPPGRGRRTAGSRPGPPGRGRDRRVEARTAGSRPPDRRVEAGTAGSRPGPQGRGRDRRVEAGTAGSRPGPPGRGRDRRVEAGTAGSRPGPPGRGRDRRVEARTAGSRPGLPGRDRDRRVEAGTAWSRPGPPGRGRDRRVEAGTAGSRPGPPGRGRDRRVEAGTAGSRPGPPGRGRDRRVEAGTAAPGQFGRSLKSDGLHSGVQSMMARPAQRSLTRHLYRGPATDNQWLSSAQVCRDVTMRHVMGSDDVTQVCRQHGGGAGGRDALTLCTVPTYILTILRERFQFGEMGNGGRQATLQI